MGKDCSANRDLDVLELGEVAEGDLSGLIAEREDHLRRRTVQRLPLPYPALDGAMGRNPVLIGPLALQMFHQRDRCQPRAALQQRQELRLPDARQGIRSGAPSGLAGLGLDLVLLDPPGTAHGDARRCGSRLLGAAGASFGHVQRSLLARQRCRHPHGPAHGPQGQQLRSPPANELVARQLRPSRESFQHVGQAVLVPDADRSRAFRSALAPADRILCGIAWNSTNADYGKRKSIALRTLAQALSLPFVQLVSLQYGDVDAQIQQVQQEAGLTVLRPPGLDCTQDLDGLGALIAACDLVVSISNTTVHLAGTIGTETWVLLEHVPDWRWGLNGTASLWYPSVSLFRQQRAGDWSHPLRQVRQRLRSRPPRGAAGGGSPPSTGPGP